VLTVSTGKSDGTNVSMLMEDISRNNYFFQVRISRILCFIPICVLFTNFTSCKYSQHDISKSFRGVLSLRVPQQPLAHFQTATIHDMHVTDYLLGCEAWACVYNSKIQYKTDP
jgi:hypothetical protein